MNWDTWKPWYKKIKKDLKLNFLKDEKAAKLLDGLLESKDTSNSLNEAKSLISNQITFVYGCGPSLEKNIEALLQLNINDKKYVNIAANGSISALIKHHIYPHINVTDLDGDINDLLDANKKGTISFVHAHGDNIPLLEKYVPKFKNIIGTTQTRPIGKVKNLGGFTDGDRGVFIAEFFEAKLIFLVGFDFGNIIGKFSKPSLNKDIVANKIKKKKLTIAKSLIKWVSTWSNATILNLTGAKDKIRGIRNVEYSELENLFNK
ncbi:MAG: 6-hydroxymethylpterin diphosphokinase MptE-like protein [Candidatus Hodarchaeota archaeon]